MTQFRADGTSGNGTPRGGTRRDGTRLRPRRGGAALPLAVAAALGSSVLGPIGAAAGATDAPPTHGPVGDGAAALGTPVATPVVSRTQAAPVPLLLHAAGVTYTVRAGDTVSHIALRAGTSVAAIVAANGLDERATIQVGQVLTLSGTDGPDAATEGSDDTDSAESAAGGSHTVRAGDTLGEIALRYGTSVSALRDANPGLDARSTIVVGQTLRVPAAAKPVGSTFAGRTYPSDTVRAAQANKDALESRDAPTRERMQHIIVHAARDHGVDPALAQAISYQESGFNMRAVSPANAVGAMQVIPSSGRWASDLAGRQLDLLDPQDNATAGVVILRALTRAEPDQATAIAGYYQGLTSVRNNGMYSDTRRYVANIQTLTERFR